MRSLKILWFMVSLHTKAFFFFVVFKPMLSCIGDSIDDRFKKLLNPTEKELFDQWFLRKKGKS